MKNPTIFKGTLLIFSCVLLTVLGLAILNSDLNADATTTIGLDINTGNITSSGTIISQDLTVQKEGDATLTVYSNTDSPADNSKLLVIQKGTGTTPSELFSVNEKGDVAIASDLAVTGNVTNGTWQGTPIATQYGGTGQDWSEITKGNLPYFSDTGTLSNLAPGTAGQFLSQESDGNPKWDNVARSATFVIAGSDSSDLSKQQADYVCDGVDDQDQVQAAIDLCPVNAKIVTIGDLTFSAPINTKANGLIIEGAGSKWILADEAKCSFVNIDHDDITIRNLIIDGNASNQTYTSGSYGSAIHINSAVSNLTISDIDFRNIWNACIKGAGTSSVPIVDGFVCERCTADNIINNPSVKHYGGLVYLSYAKHVEVGSCRISNTGVDGVKAIHSEYVNVHDIDLMNIGAHGVFIGYGSKYINVNNISMNTDKNGLEVVCVEMGGDGAIGGTPRNEYVEVSNVIFEDSCVNTSSGNNGIYFGDVNHGRISNCIINIANAPLSDSHFLLDHIYDVHLENIISTGYLGSGKYGIYLRYSSYCTISDYSMVDSPVWAWANPPCVMSISHSDHVDIAHCHFKNLPAYGILLTGGSATYNINVESCTFDDITQSDYAIITEVGVGTIKITNCAFRNLVRGMSYGGNTDVFLINNKFENVTIPLSLSGGSTATIRGNIGYTTENSGSDSVSNGGTIAHGLASTPTYINLTTSNADHIASVTSVDGNNITIGLKDNTGTAVATAETVYWKAEVR